MHSTPEPMRVAAPARSKCVGFIERLSYLWCRYLHTAVRWPINGYYHCGVCSRRYPVPWHNVRQFAPSRVQTLHLDTHNACAYLSRS